MNVKFFLRLIQSLKTVESKAWHEIIFGMLRGIKEKKKKRKKENVFAEPTLEENKL